MRAALLAGLVLGACVQTAPPPPQAACPFRAPPETLFRRERAPADAPFSNADLARDFERAVFFTEFTARQGRLVREEQPAPLARWESPIAYRLGGDRVSPADPARFRAVASRLSAATGLDIREAEAWERPDLLVTIASRAARLRSAAALEPLRGAQTEGLIYRLREDNPSIPCTASAAYDAESGEIVGAAIIIRGEADDALRELCAEEEFAQVLGPSNDDACARPSIFNDDGEFALLTDHDALILRTLYDPRLQSGMSRDEAMPLVRRIIAQLRPGG